MSLVRKGAWLTKCWSTLCRMGRARVTSRKNSMQPLQTSNLRQTAPCSGRDTLITVENTNTCRTVHLYRCWAPVRPGSQFSVQELCSFKRIRSHAIINTGCSDFTDCALNVGLQYLNLHLLYKYYHAISQHQYVSRDAGLPSFLL